AGAEGGSTTPPPLPFPVRPDSKGEAPGFDPGSRCTSAPASTCVACHCRRAFPATFIAGDPSKQGPSATNRLCFLTEAAPGSGPPRDGPGPRRSRFGDGNHGVSGEPHEIRVALLRSHAELRFSN